MWIQVLVSVLVVPTEVVLIVVVGAAVKVA